MTSQPMDFTDYLIRQQQQAWQQSRIDKLFRSDEDRDAQIARGSRTRRRTQPRDPLPQPAKPKRPSSR
jgi:hypothetical protein